MNLRDWTMNCWGVLPVLLRRAGAPPIVRDVRFRELNVWTGDVILETARCTPRRFGEVTSRNNSAASVSIVGRCASGLTHPACLPQLQWNWIAACLHSPSFTEVPKLGILRLE